MAKPPASAVLDCLDLAAASIRLKRERVSTPSIIEFAARAGFPDLDPWQRDYLLSDSRRVLLNVSRQSGKSSMSAIKATYRATYGPGRLILLLSPSLRQSGELFRKVLQVYRSTDKIEPPEAETKLQLELTNGSRILSLPGSEGTTRGFSAVDMLIVDEASRVEDELYRSVRPMLAVSGGSLLAPSTPFGKRGWWYEAWQDRIGGGWEWYEVPAEKCPRIPPAFLEEERQALGDLWYSQEYGCQFVDTTSSIFPYDAIEAAATSDVVPFAQRFAVAS